MTHEKKQRDAAWESAVRALRIEFLQHNGHIPGIEDTIGEWIVEVLDEIRATPKSQKTEAMVASIREEI